MSDLKYYPFIRLLNFILNAVVKPQVIDVMLFWSSKWKEYNNESFRDLRKVVNRSVDPLYPDGVPIISKKDSNMGQQKQQKKKQQPSILNLPQELLEAEQHKDGFDPLYPTQEQSTISSSKAVPPHSSGNAG